MNAHSLSDLLRQSSQLNTKHYEQLEALATEYPYCALSYALMAKYTTAHEPLLAVQKNRRAALYAYQRNALRRFVQAATPAAPLQATEALSLEPLPTYITPSNAPLISPSDEDPDDTRSFFDMIEADEFNIDTPTNTPSDIPTTTSPDSIDSILDTEPEPPTSAEIAQDTPTVSAYFADIEQQNPTPPAEDEPHELYETVNEGKAMGLFYDGDVRGAIKMYRQLQEIYPERKAYYQEQLSDLLGHKVYEYDMETGEPLHTTLTIPSEESVSPSVVISDSPDMTTPSTTEAVTNPIAADVAEVEESPVITWQIAQDNEASQTPPKPALELTEPASTLTESQAVYYFQQGKISEAVKVYETLKKQQPIKANYYDSQIAVLKQNWHSRVTTNPVEVAEPEVGSEAEALRLFAQGDVLGAIQTYEALMLRFPEKAGYYATQISIMKS